MQELIDQIESSLDSKLYYLSLFTALCIPDIAGSICSPDGRASGKNYIAWYEKWVRPQLANALLRDMPERMHQALRGFVNPFDGDACYKFRCSMLHQGRGDHEKLNAERIIFLEPGSPYSVHGSRLNGALCIDLVKFCTEVIAGARDWLAAEANDPLVVRNMANVVRRHQGGLAPYVAGVAVVG